MKKTSFSDPLQIDSVDVPGTGGMIGLTFCPGKKKASAISGYWDRDLDTDLEAIRAWSAQILVSLIEAHEYKEVGIEAMPDRIPRGIVHLRMPIKDVSIPDEKWEAEWEKEKPRIISVLRHGGKVCIHCMGGLGRTGLVAALLLVEFGVSPQEAIATVRKARHGTIETREEEDYVLGSLRRW